MWTIVLLLLVLIAVVGVAYLGKMSWHQIPAGYVGLVECRYGRRMPGDKEVSLYGAKGPQARILEPNTSRLLWWFKYRVTLVARTYVPHGTIGVVVARAGEINDTGRLARHVECHHFQDAVRFLMDGGQQGRQPAVLAGGYYDINPFVFDVITIDTLGEGHRDLTADGLRLVEIPVGSTGVVITHEGERPAEDDDAVGRVVGGHDGFRLPWVFLRNGGQRGAQAETLDEGGRYAINPWFAKVVQIPTRHLILEWSKDPNKPADSLDSSLEEILIQVEGHRVRLEMKQTLRVPPRAAPRLVRRFGDSQAGPGAADDPTRPTPVQRFVEKELAPVVDAYFQGISGQRQILEFITEIQDVSQHLKTEVGQALATWGIEAVNTTLEKWRCDDPEVETMLRKAAAKRAEHGVLVADLANQEILTEIELAKLPAVEAQHNVELTKVRELIRLLGPEQIAMERILPELVKMQVPQVISGGGGDFAGELLKVMPFSRIQDLITGLVQQPRQSLEKPEPPPEITGGDHPPRG